MNAANANRFNFDTVFGEDGEIVRAAPRQRPKSSFTPAEVEEIRREAFTEGSKNAEAASAVALAHALNAAAARTVELLARQDAALAAIRAEASSLAISAARRVANHALDRYPLAEIETVLAAALHAYHGEPRFVVRLTPSMAGPLQEKLPQAIEAQGYPGRVVVMGDPSLRGADCRVEWADGGLERNTDAIFAAMEAEIERWHAAEAAGGAPAALGTERG